MISILTFVFLEPDVEITRDSVVIYWETYTRALNPMVKIHFGGEDTLLSAECTEKRGKYVCKSDKLPVKDGEIRVSVSVQDSAGFNWISNEWKYIIKNGMLYPTVYLGPFLFLDGSGSGNYNIVFWVYPYYEKTEVLLEVWSPFEVRKNRTFRKVYRIKPINRGRKFVAQINQLPKDTIIYYKILIVYGKDTVETPNYSFRTFPEGFGVYRFALINNISTQRYAFSPTKRLNGVNCEDLGKMLMVSKINGVEVVFVGGDVIQPSKDTTIARIQYRSFLKCAEPFASGTPIMVVMGEGEALSPYVETKKGIYPKVRRYSKWFLESKILSPETFFAIYIHNPYTSPRGSRYMRNVFYFKYKGDIFLVLNPLINMSEGLYVDKVQEIWFKTVLRFKDDFRNIFVIFHTSKERIKNFEDLQKLFNEYNVKMAFSVEDFEKKVNKANVIICDSSVYVSCITYDILGNISPIK